MARKSIADGPGKRKARITIRDVAREAGVSVGTASTALNGARSNVVLSAATRERVIETARRLSYRPNAAARAMAGRKFKTIGLLATEYCMTGSFYGNVMRGIGNQANESGYSLMMKVVKTEMDMHDASILTEQAIDGVIIPADCEDRTRDSLNRYEIPHVWLNTERRDPKSCVHVDEIHGAGLAVDHLADLGHTRIAYMHHNVPDVHFATVMRERGYLQAMARRGLPPIEGYERYMDIAEHVDMYLDRRPRATALIIYSDAMALLAMNRVMERGLRVPDDLSIVSNEAIVLHTLAYCRLTGVLAPVEELGRAAVKMLIEQIESNQLVDSVMLEPTLEVNQSTAPPPADAPAD